MLQDTTWWDSLGCSGFVSAMHRLFSAKRADKWTHQLVPMKSSVTAKQSNSKSKVKCTWTLGNITRMIALTEYSIPIWLSYETWFIYIWAYTLYMNVISYRSFKICDPHIMIKQQGIPSSYLCWWCIIPILSRDFAYKKDILGSTQARNVATSIGYE